MSNSLYIAAIEQSSGKSLIALGIAELIALHIDKLGFFRPVVRGGDTPDNDIELIRSQYSLQGPYHSCYATTYEHALELSSSGREQELLKLILAKSESIYLRTSISSIYDRLKNEKTKRPLVSSIDDDKLKEFIAKHLFERRFFYEQANKTVTTDNKTIIEVVNKILED